MNCLRVFVLSFLLGCAITTPAAGQIVINPTPPGQLLGQRLAADFNVTTDQAIGINAAKYVVRRIVVVNPSTSLTLAVGGFYTGASKTGTTIVAATQIYTALTAGAKWLDLTLAAILGTDVLTAGTLYLSLTTAQGAAATADVYILGDTLP